MTQNAKHTPGPWYSENLEIMAEVDRNTCYEESVIASVNTEANALLIASTPDLLEALTVCRDRLYKICCHNPKAERSKQALLMADAALAKAGVKP
jgi:hypothetical protein